MNKKIYSIRFSNREKRQKIWKILTSSFFQNYIDINDSVLDIGCGYGEFINNINCKIKYGLDIDKDYGKHLSKNVTFLNSPSIKIPLSNNSIDKVFISNVFEHLKREDIEKTLLEGKRILKKGGHFLILQPNIRFLYKDYWMFFDHITPVDDRALIEIAATLGYKLHTRVERFLPFTTVSKYPSFPFLIKLYLRFKIAWRVYGKQSFLIFENM